MQFQEDGYLQPAVINYLARLGWSHGNDEVFSIDQLCAWFDLDHITSSAAQFDYAKLDWLNGHYMKQMDDAALAAVVAPRLAEAGDARYATGAPGAPDLVALVALYKERSSTLVELATALRPFFAEVDLPADIAAQHLGDAARAALADLRDGLAELPAWEKTALNDAIKATLGRQGMKMPQLAIPLRVALLGTPQTPAIDAVLAAMGRDVVLDRLRRC